MPFVTTTLPPFSLLPTPLRALYRCSKKLDVVLVVDTSGSMKPILSSTKIFLRELVSRFEIGEEKTLFAIVTYAGTAKTEFNFARGRAYSREKIGVKLGKCTICCPVFKHLCNCIYLKLTRSQ